MTREEAIKQLDTMWKMLTSAYDDIADSHVAAYTMAVDALKAQGACEDAVSRQTLQKELALYPIDDVTSDDEAGYNRAINDVQKMVLHLPSVQTDVPDTNVGDNDLISRSDAIDAVDKLSDEPIGYLEAAIDALVDLLSAQPEIVRCGQCKYAEVADKEDAQDGYTCQFHRGSIWFSGSYCSWAERRTDG